MGRTLPLLPIEPLAGVVECKVRRSGPDTSSHLLGQRVILTRQQTSVQGVLQRGNSGKMKGMKYTIVNSGPVLNRHGISPALALPLNTVAGRSLSRPLPAVFQTTDFADARLSRLHTPARTLGGAEGRSPAGLPVSPSCSFSPRIP